MKYLNLILALVFLSSCTSVPKATETNAPLKVSAMTFNVENLFDVDDDPNTSDETFLPAMVKATDIMRNTCFTRNDNPRYREECLKKDWSVSILDRKFSRLTDVVAQVNNGSGPDILILQEIENRAVLELWRDGYLYKMHYQTISHVEGPDERGIDTAVLSRLPLLSPPMLHEINLASPANTNPRPTRGILETHLRLPNGDRLVVFAVHFPSQGAPTELRKIAVEKLIELAAKVPAGSQVLMGGDFNITGKEDWKHKYYSKTLKDFTVSHLVGCNDCVGTIYFPPEKTWSFFDVLMVPNAMTNGSSNWQLNKESIRLVNSSVYQTNRWGSPARFGNGKGSVGVSDHWPLYAEIVLAKPSQTVGAQ